MLSLFQLLLFDADLQIIVLAFFLNNLKHSIVLEDPQLVALVEGRKVAEFISPPEQLINAVRESTGEAAGHVIRASNRTPIVEICVT